MSVLTAISAPPLNAIHGSYDADDCLFLLKPVHLAPTDVVEKERLIQSGVRHYSEMLPDEQVPDPLYLAMFDRMVEENGLRFAADVVNLARSIGERHYVRQPVLVSLARAGTPVGVLLKRALAKLQVDAVHYSVSIIRDRGIDTRALDAIVARHDPRDIVFVDGWTGKGTISRELTRSLDAYYMAGGAIIEPVLAVVADPAGAADISATDEDYLIPSGLLNGIVSGLVSRTVLRDDLVGPGEYHACVVLDHLRPHDRSRSFVEHVDLCMDEVLARPQTAPAPRHGAREMVDQMVADLMRTYDIADRNRIKPGLAESTRALLRRVPYRLLVRDRADPAVRSLMHLADQRGVTVREIPLPEPWKAVTIIASLGDV